MGNIQEVYYQGLCTGCGTCASVCPTSAIEIIKDEDKGMYAPQLNDELCTQCGLCLEVCPGISVDFNDLNLKIFGKQPQNIWLGNHIGLYVGHATDDEIRRKSSSGGLATALLLLALEQGIIDGAIVTRMNQHKPLEPEVILARTREEIVSARKSKYCPVPSNVRLKDVIKEKGKFAMIGLPCHIHAVRKYELLNNELQNKLVLRLGLMCSSNATFLGTEYFLQKHGVKKGDIESLEYRGDGWLQDYNFVIHLRNGDKKVIPRRGTVFASSFHLDFAVPRCLVCCDHNCEFADISLGDPRLPDLKQDKLGKSLIVSRTPVGEEILQNAQSKGAITLTESINIQRFFQGQDIRFKRGFAARLSLAKAIGKAVPHYNTAKLPQKSKFIDYLDSLSYLPSYVTHGRYVWQLIYPGAVIRTYFKSGVTKLLSIIGKSSKPEMQSQRKATRILLMGASLTKNLGGPSLFLSTRKILQAHIPDAELTIWSTAPTRDFKKARVYGVKVIGTVRHEFLNAILWCLLWAGLKKLRLNIPSLLNNNKLLKEYVNADIYIDILGISFTDFFPGLKKHMVDGAKPFIGKLLGKPAVKFTQDMGPFQRKSTRYPAKFFLGKLDLIIARSAATENYLKQIGITRHVHVRPDSAFVLDPAPPERINDILRQENLNNRPLIGMVPTIQIDRRLCGGNTEAQNPYTVMMAQIADYLIETLKATVVFIPNETYGGYDDNYVINKIYAGVKHKSNVRLITAEYTAEELKGLIGACDVLIGSRYHSVIAATSMCVPTMVIGWGHKYNEVMKMVGLTDFECDFNAITYQQLEAKVTRLWHDREKIRAELALQIPLIKETVMSGGRLVKDILDTC